MDTSTGGNWSWNSWCITGGLCLGFEKLLLLSWPPHPPRPLPPSFCRLTRLHTTGSPSHRAFRVSAIGQPGHVHHGRVWHLEVVGSGRGRGGNGHQRAIQDEVPSGSARGSDEVWILKCMCCPTLLCCCVEVAERKASSRALGAAHGSPGVRLRGGCGMVGMLSLYFHNVAVA